MHPDGRDNLDLDLKAQIATAGGKVAGDNLALKGKLTVDALRFGGLDASVSLRTPSLAPLQPMVSRPLPTLTDVQFSGRLSVPAGGGSVGFHDARLLTHEGDLAGDGRIGLGAAVAVDAKLRSTRLDLDAFRAAFGINLAVPAVAGSTIGPVIPAEPLPWATLRGPAIDATASIGELTFQDQVWRQVELAFQLSGGRMQLGTLKLALPGGPAVISITADASADPVRVSMAAHAPSVPLALVARYAGLPGQVSGTMRVDTRLQASGRSAHDLAASLDVHSRCL
jgi:AsmA protein